MINQTINQYKILEKLGEGGMGVVYKAEDTKLHRQVALKFLPTELTRDAESKQRFINEARAASALDHANICTLYEINETNDSQMYIAMSYYDGMTLKDRMKEGTIAVQQAIDIAVQIAKGLTRAHEEGIVHRDIKPANIILTSRDEVKVIDFGLAKLNRQLDLTKSGTTLGTVAYMSPEQALGSSVDQRADIWSLGVVLYEMLSGQQPFTGDHDHKVIYSILNEPHQPISDIVENIPKALAIIIDNALAKNVKDRYASMHDMLSDLLSIKDKSGKLATPVKLRKQSSSKLWLVTGFTLILIISLFGLLLFKNKTLYEKADNKIVIAVLPLKGYGEDKSDEDWFYDSMTDALNTSLTKIDDLRIIALSSIMQFKGSTKPMHEIAKALGADYLIDTSFMKVDSLVRLSPKLINPYTQENLWAENYEQSFRNILKLQSEFAQSIAHAVRVNLTSKEKQQFQEAREINPEAQMAYLRGKYLSEISGSPNLQMKALDHFRKAIELEPEYAKAYAGLAYTYVSLGAFAILPPKESHFQAQELANKALSLDPNLSEAFSSLGYADLLFTTNWQNIKHNLLRAIDLNPSNVQAQQWYAFYLNARGQHEEAISAIDKAVLLDPVSPIASNLRGLIFYFARDYRRAMSIFTQRLETHPFALVYYWLSCAQTGLGLHTEAMISIKKALELDPADRSGLFKGWLGKLYALQGQKEKALQIIEQIPWNLSETASIHAALGQHDKAFEDIEKWLSGRQFSVALYKVAPWWDPIREDPRFNKILERTGLDE